VSEPLLTIGYSALADRAAGIQLPAKRPDTEIVVVVQGGAVPPGPPVRDDVRYVELDSRGVAKSRNEVLRRARGQFVMFADDDVVLVETGIRQLLTALIRNDGLALAQGAVVDDSGQLRKRYPSRSVPLHRWNAAKAATYELVVRRSAFARAGVRFDENFGAGAEEYYLGDEYVFIADAVSAGLRCRFFPVVVARHDATSSGSGFGSRRDAAARAAVFDRVFRRWAPLARLAFVARSPRRFRTPRLMAQFVQGRFGT
jgi:glycosyltransferase involved in cell wall biosynthesis